MNLWYSLNLKLNENSKKRMKIAYTSLISVIAWFFIYYGGWGLFDLIKEEYKIPLFCITLAVGIFLLIKFELEE